MKLLDGVTKALTLHQPYATLIAAGIKHWETRYNPPGGPMCPAGALPLPGLPVAAGERIAIHAAKSDTALYQFGNDDVPGLRRDGHIGGCDLWYRDAGSHWSILFPDRRDWFPLPFGAIVGTAVVAEVLPIFGMERIYDRPDRPPESAVPYIWYGLKEPGRLRCDSADRVGRRTRRGPGRRFRPAAVRLLGGGPLGVAHDRSGHVRLSDPVPRSARRMADPDRACVVSPEEWFAGCVCGMVDRPHDEALMYAALGLGGETGEVLEPIKKSVRTTDPTPLDRDNMVSELGDVMFYAGAIANLLGITLSEIVEANVAKRVARGLISGAGDATDPEPSPVDAVDQPFRVTREQLEALDAKIGRYEAVRRRVYRVDPTDADLATFAAAAIEALEAAQRITEVRS